MSGEMGNSEHGDPELMATSIGVTKLVTALLATTLKEKFKGVD